LHDGGNDTVFRHFDLAVFSQQSSFNPEGFPFTPDGDTMRMQLESYLLAFDSNLAPIVGQQVTLGDNDFAAASPRLDLLESRANLGECDLIAKTQLFGREVGFLYTGGGKYLVDHEGVPPIPGAALRLLATAPKLRVTYTCLPPGSGVRAGIDRDGDGFL